MNACLPCRRVKMRCRPSGPEEGSVCERCTRKSLECVYRQHRRGRKPGTKISKKRASSDPQVSPLVEQGDLKQSPFSNGSPVETNGISAAVLRTQPGGLQPSGILNQEAMSGKFSLRCILTPSESETTDNVDESSHIPDGDPITLGLVNISIAKSLFENFITELNPYISQLDPHLHTFSYVRSKSPFLFSTVLAMASKAFNPALYRPLYDHTQDLFADSFRHGTKSAETAQAILILTYWKEPQDTRAWTSLGYAIRMCIDLGWHNLTPYSMRNWSLMSESEKREIRNIERTWYVMFVYDRSMSLQVGKPWMIECNEFVESIDAWCNDPMATANDCLLGALVTLRIMTSTVLKLLRPRERAPLHNVDALLALVNSRVEEWENRWLTAIEAKESDQESCHPFLIQFYSTHLRLQLFSIPLADAITSSQLDSSPSLELLWIAYSSAMDMFQLISRHSSRLYFVQDSIHVMTAYSATFLVKEIMQLLLLAPTSIVSKIENSAINAIRNAAAIFSQQAAPPGSSCVLQARFLDNIIATLVEKQKQKMQSSIVAFSNADCSEYAIQKDAEPIVGDLVAPNLSDRTGLEVADGSMLDAFQVDDETNNFQVLDDDVWVSMFASAGFNTQDGIFLA